MNDLQSSIDKLNRQVKRRNWEKALKDGNHLWSFPFEGQLTDLELRNKYVDAIKKVAEIYTDINGDPFSGAKGFKRVYELADEQLGSLERASDKEYAAYRLGLIYEKAKLPHSAVYWFKRTLDLARERKNGENLHYNLYLVATSYETLGDLKQAGDYYHEILELSDGLSSTEKYISLIVPAAMFQIRYADSADGEKLFLTLANVLFQSKERPLPNWFFAALNALGMHYIIAGRLDEAKKLARMVMVRFRSFEDEAVVKQMMYGMIARAHLHAGRLDKAQENFSYVHPVDSTEMINGSSEWVEILEFWLDIARIHTAQGNFSSAFAAYETLAYNMGAFIINKRKGDTLRNRTYWLQQQTKAVHEMVSVWLEIPKGKMKNEFEARVANAILQMKANLFLSIEVNQLDFQKVYEQFDLVYFTANRSYANAARLVLDQPENIETMLDLEDALFGREQLERRMVTNDILSIPGVSRMLSFDFRKSREIGENVLLDYSVIDYCPPGHGLKGIPQGRHYIGVMLKHGNLRIVDLGKAENIEPLCINLIWQISHQLFDPNDKTNQIVGGNLQTLDLSVKEDKESIDTISVNVYNRIIAPFESMDSSIINRPLIISPDGVLAGLPFHALVHKEQYLIEERDIVYCHSLLQRESLSIRQMSPGSRMVPSISRNVTLLGNADYQQSQFISLPGTEWEINQIGGFLKSRGSFEEVNILTGTQATVSQLLEYRFPKIVHIAAHGTFSEITSGYPARHDSAPDDGYRRWEEMAVWPISQLDSALLRSILILSPDKVFPYFPVEGRILTALELSSLNLIGSELVVLSACDTGVGVSQSGAGIVGFQYALSVSKTRAGIVSLWKVLDRETGEFMVDFYRSFLDQRNAKAGYLEAARRHCRINHKRVHPYYWAAFSFLDLNYYSPF